MSAATAEFFADGRTVIGLGVSTETLIEGWHGITFERPLRCTRETIEVVRQAFRAETLEYSGEIFEIGPYEVGSRSIRTRFRSTMRRGGR